MSNMPKTNQILIVEDEEIIRKSLCKLLERHGYGVCEAVSIKAARETFVLDNFSLIISDLRLPGQLGTDLIKMVAPVPVLIMTSYASLRSAVDTMRQGAVDYISKPFDHDEMMVAVRRILNASQKNATTATISLQTPSLLGSSEAIKKVTRLISKVAASDLPILIQGETGSGKSAVAMAIHNTRKCSDKAFISIDCAGIKESELVTQLGTSDLSVTVFLNNIGELPLSLQPHLLRHIQRSNCSFICSTDQDLEQLCQGGLFRKDLYYQINVVSITMPPLRQRSEDIPLIANAILAQLSDSHRELSEDGRKALANYHWPGNLLQLKNTLQQAAILASEDTPIDAEQLGLCDLPLNPYQESDSVRSTLSINQVDDAPAGLSLEDYFTRFVLENQENMSETDLAKKLGISRKSLWERRNKLGISRKKGDELVND